MKPTKNRLQVLLSLVKNIAARSHEERETCLEPWELATGKMEQLELVFEPERRDSAGDSYGKSQASRGFATAGLY